MEDNIEKAEGINIENDIEKSYLSEVLKASSITGNLDEVNKAFSNIIEKGKKANIGEIREWSGKKFKKTGTGWEPVKSEKGGEKREEQFEDLDIETQRQILRKVFPGGSEKLINQHVGRSLDNHLPIDQKEIRELMSKYKK